MKIEGHFGAEALRILRDVPGVAVEKADAARGGGRGDAVLRFGPAAEAVAVEVKRRANAATAWQIVQQSRAAPDGNLLLVAGATTADAREILERHGVALVDGLGNAHVELPGFVLHTEAQRGRRAGTPRPQTHTRLAGKAGVGAQALLLEPARDWKVQDLAGEAGISVGLAHRVLVRLETEGLVAAEGAGPRRVRRVADPTALLDLWAEENTDRAVRRARAYRLAREPPVAEIWIDSVASLDDAAVATGAEAVESGHNLAFVQANGDEPLAFRRQVDGIWAVNSFRLFYDLRNDPRRGHEQAETLRREVIGF